MTEDSFGRRKRLRVGHVSERGGINAVRSLLEAYGMVVDEVSGRNDYGRDLNVDIVKDGEVTGMVIGVQVKGDRQYIRPGGQDWELPFSSIDRRFWAESSVPIIGVLWDPMSDEMRWTNLTAGARATSPAHTWPFRVEDPQPFGPSTVRFPSTRRLDRHTLPEWVNKVCGYIRQSSAPALLGLFDAQDDRRCHAIFYCWALGRSDARAFLLLRRAIPSLRDRSLLVAIDRLSHLTSHPDIFWNATNWIPSEVTMRVLPAFRWSAQEIYQMVAAVEHQDGEYAGWERGGRGQSLWCLLIEDPSLDRSVLSALALAIADNNLDVGFRLLLIHQSLANDPRAAIKDTLLLYPELTAHELAGELLDQLDHFGYVPLF